MLPMPRSSRTISPYSAGGLSRSVVPRRASRINASRESTVAFANAVTRSNSSSVIRTLISFVLFMFFRRGFLGTHPKQANFVPKIQCLLRLMDIFPRRFSPFFFVGGSPFSASVCTFCTLRMTSARHVLSTQQPNDPLDRSAVLSFSPPSRLCFCVWAGQKMRLVYL